MKIALANNLYYPYNRGGAETVVKKMITDLKARGHEVFLITTKPKSDANPINSDLKIYYIPSDYSRLAELSVLKKVLWHFNNIFSFKSTAAIKKILAEEKPGLILTHNLMGLGFLLPVAIRDLNITHRHYLHDIQLLYPSGLMMFGEENIVDGFSAKVYQLFTRYFFGSPSKIISPSKWLLEQHRQRGFFPYSKTEVKNLIKADPDEETEKNTETIIKNTNPRNNFLFVGQVEIHKGIMLLINAFKEALLIKPDLKLIIVGDGEKLNAAKELAADKKQIEFRGRLNSEEVKALMLISDYLIIPSLCYENAPMTIFEAHHAGLSVLAANIGGISEIINDNDKLFKPGDMADLKNNILNSAKPL
jgi:glycosyltransferase involved in cell wall biosynthesis